MATSKNMKMAYKKLDPELVKEIVDCVKHSLREEEASIVKTRHDGKRANIKLLLRKYREIVEHVDNAVFEAAQVNDDLKLQDLLEMMGGRRESFYLEAMRENIAGARLLVDHMNKMLERYRLICESSDKNEEVRRYRIIHAMYIAPERKKVDDIAEEEFIDKSTIYRDIDAATNTLAVLFFGYFGLKFL